MISCSRSEELQKTLTQGRWPLAASADLHDHVNGCRMCAELVRVGAAFQQDRAAMLQAKRLDSPSLLWWRAQLRRRQVAMETVSRPMWGAQIAAVLASLLVAAGFVGYFVRDGVLQSTVESTIAGFGTVTIVALLMLLAIAGGVIVYLTLERE